MHDDTAGGATIVLVGVIATIVLLLGGLSTAGRIFVLSEKARAAADQAALAGAATLLAEEGGQIPCARARSVAQANGAEMTGCVVASESVQVRVEVSGPVGFHPAGLARAGSPQSAQE